MPNRRQFRIAIRNAKQQIRSDPAKLAEAIAAYEIAKEISRTGGLPGSIDGRIPRSSWPAGVPVPDGIVLDDTESPAGGR